MKFAILAFLVAIIASILLIDRKNRTKMLKLTFGLATVLILSGVVLVKSNLGDFLARSQSNPTLEDFFYERYLRSDIGDISSGRFDIWHQIISEAIKRPFTGKGLGVEGFKVKTIVILVHEHNIIFWFLRRFGFIGAIIFILLGIKFYNFASSVYRNEENPINKALLHASLTYCLAYLFINLVSIMVFTFESAVIFWLNVSIIFLVHREQLAKSQIVAYGQLHRTVLD
jgi:O-antigen ligase